MHFAVPLQVANANRLRHTSTSNCQFHSMQRFLFDTERMYPWMSLNNFGCKDGDVIDLLVEQSGC